MRLFQRSPEPWEVVECRAIDPVPTYDQKELEGMQITRVCSAPMHRTYIIDLKHEADLQRAVKCARQKLMQEVSEKEYNLFLTEGWSISHLRRGKYHRAEVRYTARPAYAPTADARTAEPPFLAMLR
ncbi:hypothetical protein GY45DRAFT_1316074 [Cubamyces sp. BRFM 1775]|nr:hypothetical protein GY45DRAFT_1316074 [Cubamyces sp. BRFM 1775]